jgi:two-component system chemotaxis sensor kinase CheA
MNKFETDGPLSEFFSECDEILQRISLVLAKLESQELSSEAIDSLYRDVHTLKGSSQLFGFQNIGLIAHAIEASLEPVRKKKAKLERGFVDQVFKSLDLIDSILKNPQRDLENDPTLKQELLEVVPRLISLSNKRFGTEFELTHSMVPTEDTNTGNLPALKEEIIMPEILNASLAEAQLSPLKQKSEKLPAGEEQQLESSTIRVQVSLLDKLMNLVGEMVLARNQLLQFARTNENNEFLNLTQRLDLVTSELQDNVMRTRMQPIGSVFTKFQRVVRDLSRELGKEVELVIEGAETELDKSLLEAIKDPLTHIVRNSCDHGIEGPEERKKKGKSKIGTISLKAFHEGGHVVIEIRDNGRGLDSKKILPKAIEKRLITQEQAKTLSLNEIQQLIFAPGFSTADQVSSVSGRGVGMDVVKTNIERVGGSIDLSSQLDQGTRLRLIIPLTLAIVPAMIVRMKKDFFAIPQVKLQELIRVDLEEAGKKMDKLQGNYIYRLRGELLTLIDLSDLLKKSIKGEKSRTIFNIVVLKTDGDIYGLVVDEICDTADIVVKPLPQFLKKIDVFSGSTIMGDGSVALILDIQGVANRSGVHKGTQTKALKSQADSNLKNIQENKTEYLFFKLSHRGVFSIPLILVNRLEEFSTNEIEVSGNERMVKYRGSLLPLIDLNQYLGHKTAADIDVDKKLSVIVVSKHNRFFGLVVNEILDVLSSASDVTQALKETKGLMGTIIFNDTQVVTILDALSIISDAIGEPVEIRKLKKFTNTKVLFAEDTIFFVRQVKKVLEAAGMEVDHAENGQVALDKLKMAGPGYYKLILSDIEMPVMNGYDFAKAVKGDPLYKETPMIALTTRFTERDQKVGLESGFNKYLEKLKSDELLEALHYLLGAK